MNPLSPSAKPIRCASGLLALLFFITVSVAPTRQAWGLSLSDEKSLGRKLLEKVREHLPLIEDGEIVAYVQYVGNRIVKQIGPSPYEYQFFVVDESVPNAFAIPGGYVFIYRGLIELLTTEGELASILSHELAHIQARHIHRRMQQGRILSIAALVGALAAAFVGLKGGAAGALTLGTAAGASSLGLKYSRENEEEADQLGMRLLCAAGYRPTEMVSAMERLNRGQWRPNARIASYLSTHPALGDRIQYLEVMARERQSSGSSLADRPASDDFLLMRTALVSEYADMQVAMDRFQADARRDGNAADYGFGRLYLRHGQLDRALPYLQKAARQHSDSPLVLSTLGSAYFQLGRLQESLKVLQTASLLEPKLTIVRFRLALVLQDLGRQSEALQQLQQIKDFAPSFPEIDHHLGVLLGRSNQLGPAHYHLGRYYQHKQDWDATLFHYEKAKPLLRGTPYLAEEIEQELKEVQKKKRMAVRSVFDRQMR